jgi:hypothetical protein
MSHPILVVHEEMTRPLILQIQEAALDSKTSVTDALRKAKIACMKLGLTEFGNWVDHELNGYMNRAVADVPEYRKLRGIPQAYNQYQGWQPIIFPKAENYSVVSLATIGMSISAIEDSLRGTNNRGEFGFPYSPAMQIQLRKSLNWGDDLRIKLSVYQIAGIVHKVREILLGWTVEMEKQGILGENLTFSSEDREKSAAVTANTVNNISINQVGSFVQSAEHSVVQGGIDSTQSLSDGVRDLVQQVEQLLPAANLLAPVKDDVREALGELNEAASAKTPDRGRLRKGLETLRRVLAPAGEHLLKIAVDAVITKLLGPQPPS